MSQPNILIVDDSKSILKAILRTFRFEGYEMHCAASATEALEVLAHNEIDVLLTDQTMPGTSGIELLNQVHLLYPSTIRMMITGSTDIETAKKAINEGNIWRFFTKPWEDFELITGVRQALAMKVLEKENLSLKSSVEKQNSLLSELKNKYPGIADIKQDEDGSIIID